MEIISIDILDIDNSSNFIDNIDNFDKLKCFYVKNVIFQNNNQLIKLLSILSNLKSLLHIELTIPNKLQLNKDDNNKICKLFPDITIESNNNSTFIKWNNHNLKLNYLF